MNLLCTCRDLNQYYKDTKRFLKGNEVDLQIEIECCKNKNMKQKLHYIIKNKTMTKEDKT